MTSLSAPTPARPGTPMRGPLLIGLAGLVTMVAIRFAAPALALHAWLIGFTFAAAPTLGAVALLLIHALTGGRWGEAHRPALLSLARGTPLLILLLLPLIVGAHATYPWAADPSTAGRNVPQFYLNPLAVGLRSIVGLGLLSWFAWRLGRGRPGMLEAGLGLCVYAVFVNATAYDWLLSLAPRFTSSAFGMQIIAGQMLAALSRTVLASNARRGDPSWGDVGALMLATTLGLSYLILMGLAIDWYGDKPEQADWYMSRTLHGWLWLEVAGAVVAASTMGLLLFARIRRGAVPLKPVALWALAGLLIEYVWLVSPATEPWSALAALVAALAAMTLLLGASRAVAHHQDGRHGD